MRTKASDFINSILLILFCTSRFWGYNFEWYVSLTIRIVAIIFLIISNNLKIKLSKEVFIFSKITVLPIVLIAIYSCVLWFIVDVPPRDNVIRNLFTSSAYLLIDIVFAALIYTKYKEKSVDLFVKCGFFSYIISSIIPVIVKFPSSSLLYLLTSHSTNYDLLYLTEVNDLTFGVGFCLLYYLFFDEREKKYKRPGIIMCILLIFWGLKRIEICALLLCYLFYTFVLKKNSVKRVSTIATIIVLLVSYIYIMFIHNSELTQLATKYNVNFMGRLTTYQYVAETYSNFSPRYLGIGFGYIDEILENLVSSNFRVGYIPVISLHSDILRMYIGIGFIGFGLWTIYQLKTKTKAITKYIDERCAKAYLIYTVFLFILYLTDNTYSYPITFTLYLVCTLATIRIITNEKGKKSELNNEKRL